MQTYRFGSKQPYIMRQFRCTACGYVMIAAKQRRFATRTGHVKHMYCPVCRETTEHHQISEWEKGADEPCHTAF